jgi:hypothetical protein
LNIEVNSEKAINYVLEYVRVRDVGICLSPKWQAREHGECRQPGPPSMILVGNARRNEAGHAQHFMMLRDANTGLCDYVRVSEEGIASSCLLAMTFIINLRVVTAPYESPFKSSGNVRSHVH